MITLEDLFNCYLTGQRNFKDVEISLGKLKERDLSEIDLSNATLLQVSLINCNLSGANLTNAKVIGSDLEGINLSNANLSQANLSRANFCMGSDRDYAQLRNIILANWSGVLENLPPEVAETMRDQMLSQMSEQMSEFLFPVSLKKSNLVGANLTGIDLRRADLQGADLQDANLSNANLDYADLQSANLSNANLTGIKCDRTNFSQANLRGAIVEPDTLKRALLNWTIMPDGIKHRHSGLELINSKINPLKRKAWFPVTIERDGDLTTSKFAGKPWLNSDESFPRCGCCNNLMRFFFQLNLEEVPSSIEGEFGEGLLQFFYCVDCDDYQAFSQSYLVRIIKPEGEPAEYELPNFQDAWTNNSLVRKSKGQFPARIILNWREIIDYPDWEDAEASGASLNDEELKIILSSSEREESELEELEEDLSSFSNFEREYHLLSQRSEIVAEVMYQEEILSYGKDKLGGYPRWVQDPIYPNCPQCDRSMNRLVFEFASDDNIPYLWGDGGTGYFLQCPKHQQEITFLWQCG